MMIELLLPRTIIFEKLCAKTNRFDIQFIQEFVQPINQLPLYFGHFILSETSAYIL